MLRTLWIASTGMQAQNMNIDVIANNLANVNTAGFKRSRIDFQDLLYRTIRPAGVTSAQGSEVPTGIQMGHGTRSVATQKIFTGGDFQATDNELDMAIEGDGFFQVLQPNGEIAYTRAGAFKLDSDGRVVTSDGYTLEPEMSFPDDALSVSIGSDGTVSVLQAGDTEPSEVGNIELGKFLNPGGLKSIGKNLFLPTKASGDVMLGTPGEDGFGTLAQGYLEMSNVNVVEEMVHMIAAQRAYEINSKAIKTADDILQMANNIKR
ncbi:MAG: flagellar basal-body rod protein FlgG [Deltaproteobacteria bacterium]|nr:flagellar basal-body rod protein FlgG [Deltaproteobacteria bacterium]